MGKVVSLKALPTPTRRIVIVAGLVALVAACGPVHFSDVEGAPKDRASDPFQAPDDAPPTGSKWEGRDVKGECGRTYRAWVLVDEVCGASDSPATPMRSRLRCSATGPWSVKRFTPLTEVRFG
jgi:hypothetical protein